MIKYLLRQNAIDMNSATPIEDYLRSFGIEEVDSFIDRPAPTDRITFAALTNISRCVKELHKGFTTNKSFFLIVDSDADGYTSSAIFYNYFKSIYPDVTIQWMLHEGKEHGIVLDAVPYGCDYVIVPDAGSMQLEQQEELVNRGKKVIIIDHHNVTDTFNHPDVVLVNNQASVNFSNKFLSGAGMVLKVIEAYQEVYNPEGIHPDDLYDLAALGILSDCMDITTLDNNYIIYHGLRNIKSEIFKALIVQQQRGFKDLAEPTKIETVFYVTPLINGTIREGSQEEKALLFRAFIHNPTSEIIETEWRGNPRKETFYQYVARLAHNAKGRQDDKKLKSFEFLRSRIVEKGLDKNQIVVVVADKNDKVATPQPITGLIAMELQKEFGKPCLVLRPRMQEMEVDGQIKQVLTYAGSGRGSWTQGFESFLGYMRNDPAVVYAEGHHFAFGASILADELDAFLARCNENLAHVTFGGATEIVEGVFTGDAIRKKTIIDFVEANHIYGTGIPAPKFALDGVLRGSNITVVGANKSVIKFTFGGIECVKFKAADIVEQLGANCDYRVVAVCKPDINIWGGRVSPQFKIDLIELTPIETKKLF